MRAGRWYFGYAPFSCRIEARPILLDVLARGPGTVRRHDGGRVRARVARDHGEAGADAVTVVEARIFVHVPQLGSRGVDGRDLRRDVRHSGDGHVIHVRVVRGHDDPARVGGRRCEHVVHGDDRRDTREAELRHDGLLFIIDQQSQHCQGREAREKSSHRGAPPLLGFYPFSL